MEAPHDVNSSQMRAVYGNRIRLDDPLLGDNPKVAALRKERDDTNLKGLIDEALRKFFFPEPASEPEPEAGHESEVEELEEIEEISQKSDEKLSTLVSMFKMLLDTVFRSKMK